MLHVARLHLRTAPSLGLIHLPVAGYVTEGVLPNSRSPLLMFPTLMASSSLGKSASPESLLASVRLTKFLELVLGLHYPSCVLRQFDMWFALLPGEPSGGRNRRGGA